MFFEAVHWFEKSWNTYDKSPDWVCRYIYALVQTNAMERAVEIAEECIQLKQGDIEEEQAEECDEHWTESDQAAYLIRLQKRSNNMNIFSNRLPLVLFHLLHSRQR